MLSADSLPPELTKAINAAVEKISQQIDTSIERQVSTQGRRASRVDLEHDADTARKPVPANQQQLLTSVRAAISGVLDGVLTNKIRELVALGYSAGRDSAQGSGQRPAGLMGGGLLMQHTAALVAEDASSGGDLLSRLSTCSRSSAPSSVRRRNGRVTMRLSPTAPPTTPPQATHNTPHLRSLRSCMLRSITVHNPGPCCVGPGSDARISVIVSSGSGCL